MYIRPFILNSMFQFELVTNLIVPKGYVLSKRVPINLYIRHTRFHKNLHLFFTYKIFHLHNEGSTQKFKHSEGGILGD